MNGSTQYGRYIQAENGKENTFAAGNALERRQNGFQYVPRLSSGTDITLYSFPFIPSCKTWLLL